MSTFEQSEVLDFPDVWFLGLEAKKIEGVPGAAQNNGMFSLTLKYRELRLVCKQKWICGVEGGGSHAGR